MAQAADLAVEYRFDPAKGPFDTPASAIQIRHPGRGDFPRQLGPEPDLGFARFGRGGEDQPNALLLPQFIRRQADGLDLPQAGVAGSGVFPYTFLLQLRRTAGFAHDEARLGLLPALQQSAGTEMAVCNPQLARASARHQGGRCRALAFVGVLAGDEVRDPTRIGIVHHQGRAR